MARSHAKIILETGETHTYPLTPATVVKAEEYLAARGTTLAKSAYTAIAFAAYTQARRRSDTQASFMDWLATIAEMEEVAENDPEDEDGTFPTPSQP